MALIEAGTKRSRAKDKGKEEEEAVPDPQKKQRMADLAAQHDQNFIFAPHPDWNVDNAKALAVAMLENYKLYVAIMKEDGLTNRIRSPRIYMSDLRNYVQHLTEAMLKSSGSASFITKLQDAYRDIIGKADQTRYPEGHELTGRFTMYRYTPNDPLEQVFKRIRSSVLQNPGSAHTKICGPSGMDLDYLDDLFTDFGLRSMHRLYTLEGTITEQQEYSVPLAFAYFSRALDNPTKLKLELLCAKSDEDEIEVRENDVKPRMGLYLMRRALIDLIAEYTEFSLDALDIKLVPYYHRNFGARVVPMPLMIPTAEDNHTDLERAQYVQRHADWLLETGQYDKFKTWAEAEPMFKIYYRPRTKTGPLIHMVISDFTKIKTLVNTPYPTQWGNEISAWLTGRKVYLFSQNIPMSDFLLPPNAAPELLRECAS